MRTTCWGAAGIGWLLLVLPVSAQQDFATPIAKKAVEAVGKLDEQKKLQGFTCQGDAKFQVDNNVMIEMSGTWSFSGFDNVRADLTVTANGQGTNGVMVVAGKQAWFREASRNKAEKAPEQVMPILLADFHALRLAQQPYRMLNKEYELSNLGEFEINKKPAVGLKVKLKDLAEVDLFFSKETGLPMKAAVRVTEPDGKEMEHAFVFDNYKQVNGLNCFSRVEFHRDNMKMFDMELTNLQFQESLDATLFQEP
jgi:hypothetical protein